jgi:hypothetical protein
MTRETWTYWISRDSINGELSGKCSLWYAKPIRVKHRYRVTWVGADHRAPAHLGDHPPDHVAAWFGVYPETDLELIRVEQTPTAKMLAEAEKH